MEVLREKGYSHVARQPAREEVRAAELCELQPLGWQHSSPRLPSRAVPSTTTLAVSARMLPRRCAGAEGSLRALLRAK